MNRRKFLGLLVGTAALGLAGKGFAMSLFNKKKTKDSDFPFQLTNAEWRKRLSPEAYYVLREAGTERSGSSPLDKEKRQGVFHCAGCDHPLFSSEHKFDSGTGWPSFWQPINDQAIGTTTDYVLLYPRTEEHCANCGGHLGHIFDDGPKPTGKRHCINGIALNFKLS